MKVRALPYQPHCFAFGGFELQMLEAMRAVQQAGVDARPLDVWSRDAEFDILHVWGLAESQSPAVYWARRSGKRVVMTALLPSLTPAMRVRNLGSRLWGRARALRELVSLLDLLVVVNEAQAETAETMLGAPPDKIAVIPNIVADQYFVSVESGGASGLGIRDYLICTGNVCQRKNQLKLAQAALAAGVPLLLVGPVLVGEEAYAEALGRLIAGRESIRWIAGLPAGSPELLAAYRGSIGFALASYNETQPISALEAAAAGKPLLLADRPWARQSFYRGAHLVDPDSPSTIQAGIERLRLDAARYIPAAEILEQCRGDRVGQAYALAFQQVMRG